MASPRTGRPRTPAPLTAQDIATLLGNTQFLAHRWKCMKCRAVYRFDVPSLPPDGGCRRCQGICWETKD